MTSLSWISQDGMAYALYRDHRLGVWATYPPALFRWQIEGPSAPLGPRGGRPWSGSARTMSAAQRAAERAAHRFLGED